MWDKISILCWNLFYCWNDISTFLTPQEKGNSHIDSYILIFNTPSTQDVTAYFGFIKNTLNTKLPEPEDKSDLFEFVKAYHIFILIQKYAGDI